MAYTNWSVTTGETPSASKWNQLSTNDAGFKDGTNIDNDAIVSRHLSISSTDANGWSVMDFGDHKIAWKSGTITGGSRGAGVAWSAGGTTNLPVGCANIDAVKNMSYSFRMTGNAYALGINVESAGTTTQVSWAAINNGSGTIDFGTPEYWCQIIF